MLLLSSVLLLRFPFPFVCLIPLASCSILFSEQTDPIALDAGRPDAPVLEPDAEPTPEFFYDFEEPTWEKWQNRGCDRAIDPKDPSNQIVCCETTGTQNAVFTLGLGALGVASAKHVEIGFRVLPELAPKGVNTAFSPLVGATDSVTLEEVVVVNMNMYSDNSIRIVSFPSGVIPEPSPSDAFALNEWSQVKMIASTQEDCDLSAEINSSTSVGVQDEHVRGDFENLIFGIFRQNANIQNRVRRCFDDISIRLPTSCAPTP